MAWILPAFLAAIGLLVEYVTVATILRTLASTPGGPSRSRSSGLPGLGPLCLSLAYVASPLTDRAWIAWAPWGLETLLYALWFARKRGGRSPS